MSSGKLLYFTKRQHIPLKSRVLIAVTIRHSKKCTVHKVTVFSYQLWKCETFVWRWSMHRHTQFKYKIGTSFFKKRKFSYSWHLHFLIMQILFLKGRDHVGMVHDLLGIRIISRQNGPRISGVEGGSLQFWEFCTSLNSVYSGSSRYFLNPLVFILSLLLFSKWTTITTNSSVFNHCPRSYLRCFIMLGIWTNLN